MSDGPLPANCICLGDQNGVSPSYWAGDLGRQTHVVWMEVRLSKGMSACFQFFLLVNFLLYCFFLLTTRGFQRILFVQWPISMTYWETTCSWHGIVPVKMIRMQLLDYEVSKLHWMSWIIIEAFSTSLDLATPGYHLLHVSSLVWLGNQKLPQNSLLSGQAQLIDKIKYSKTMLVEGHSLYSTRSCLLILTRWNHALSFCCGIVSIESLCWSVILISVSSLEGL
jgi:hypothetical protein